MKKFFRASVFLMLLIALCVAFFAVVFGENAVHTHSPQGVWKSDSISHWRTCVEKSCTDKLNKALHIDEDGNGKCDTCQYSMNVKGFNLDFSSPVAAPGQTAFVEITISGNPGIAGLDLKLDFDRDNLKIKEIIYENWKATDNLAFCGDGRLFSLVFFKTSNTYVNGVLATLVFEVSGNAKSGEYPIELSLVEAINQSTEDIFLSVNTGKITITDSIVGDVNFDSVIDVRDCVALAQYLAGWDVSVGVKATDCNGDGKISIKDIILLAQYLAGWNVSLG